MSIGRFEVEDFAVHIPLLAQRPGSRERLPSKDFHADDNQRGSATLPALQHYPSQNCRMKAEIHLVI